MFYLFTSLNSLLAISLTLFSLLFMAYSTSPKPVVNPSSHTNNDHKHEALDDQKQNEKLHQIRNIIEKEYEADKYRLSKVVSQDDYFSYNFNKLLTDFYVTTYTLGCPNLTRLVAEQVAISKVRYKKFTTSSILLTSLAIIISYFSRYDFRTSILVHNLAIPGDLIGSNIWSDFILSNGVYINILVFYSLIILIPYYIPRLLMYLDQRTIEDKRYLLNGEVLWREFRKSCLTKLESKKYRFYSQIYAVAGKWPTSYTLTKYIVKKYDLKIEKVMNE